LKSPLLLLVSVLIFSSCTRQKERPLEPEILITTFPNEWFQENSEHALVEGNGSALPHLLFDTTPELNLRDHTVNVVITTPANSPHAYAIDLSSGQRHYSHSYCKQKDAWNQYPGMVNRPGFAQGYIPRVLDQLGTPQKVIVFAKTRNYANILETNYHKVRLLGAYVEQICPEGNCLGKENWLSRLVFIAIDHEDPELSNVRSLEEFKKVFDWDLAKAELGNIDGNNSIGDQTYPATKVGFLVEYDKAFPFFKSRSIFLTEAELKKIRSGCYSLYEKLWEEVGKEKNGEAFAKKFQTLTKGYFKEISTCEKFVYHGNVNKNPEKFWFLSYMGIFYRLHRSGYAFSCKNRAWQRNVLDVNGSYVYDLVRDISSCKPQDIDLAMSYLPNFLKGLKGEQEYFKFVDYDNHEFGTHRKLYSWVKVRALKQACGKDPNTAIRNGISVFPEDISWKEVRKR
jgi:hypothetical protein